MKFFVYDYISNTISLDQPEIVLVKEFGALLEEKRNKSKDDPKGALKKRAFKEFTYIYLMYDWESPYSEYAESDRRYASLTDAGLEEKDVISDEIVSAINKYKDLQESDRGIRLVRAAQKKADQLIWYLEEGSNLAERDSNGKPIFKAKDVMQEFKEVRGVIDDLYEMEETIKKKQKAESTLRAGAKEGFRPRKKN